MTWNRRYDMSKSNYIILNPKDNVGVVIARHKTVPLGHKIALKAIKAGEPVIKFGQPIGIAKKSIRTGEHVHVHNIRFSDKIRFSMPNPAAPKKQDSLPSYFQGYLRKDRRAGTRNYVLVVSTVNCSAGVAKEVAGHFTNKRLKVDGVIPVTHSSGCAQPIGGRSDILLNRTLAGWINNPNVVAALVIGLGCEDISMESINSSMKSKNNSSRPHIESFNVQDVGGTKKAIALGISKINKMLTRLPTFERVKLPVSMLTVALNCGGSDAFSAITANPALGAAADILVAKGGTVVLGETPECFGAEKYLSRRCIKSGDGRKLSRIFEWWNEWAEMNKFSMNNNLAPGNIEGGISTILEKSLGAIEKGGSSMISQVLDYGKNITRKGMIFMDTPGFDPVSVTGMAAGGCNIVAFTTGRGSMFGCSIAPTIKISTTSELYKKLTSDIDMDAGVALSKNNIAQLGRELYNFLLRVAGGTKTKSEIQHLGKEEFVPWQLGENL
jgi:altronate hydrolase